MFEKILLVILVGFLCALLWVSNGKSAPPDSIGECSIGGIAPDMTLTDELVIVPCGR